MHLQQCETLLTVESTTKADVLDPCDQGRPALQGAREDAVVGDVVVFETAHRQRIIILLHAYVMGVA